MPNTIQQIPVSDIDSALFFRDCAVQDKDAFAGLLESIPADGLRDPIAVFELVRGHGPCKYGLVTGYDSLLAFRTLHGNTSQTRYTKIPAIVSNSRELANSLTGMIEENGAGSRLRPLEIGQIALNARDQGIFPTLEQAVRTLYPAVNANKRSRLYRLARVAEQIDGAIVALESLNQSQALRLDNAFNKGFGTIIRTTLGETGFTDVTSQWNALLPILAEAESRQP